MNGPHLRTLARALETLGGNKERLAAALSVTVEDLDAYVANKKAVPQPVFLAALDIVAGRKQRGEGDR